MTISKILICVVLFGVTTSEQVLESDELIKSVNNKHTTWKAGNNFGDLPKAFKNILLGEKKLPKPYLKTKPFSDGKTDKYSESIVDSFDAREYWPKCKSLKYVWDQGPCGSCWAVTAASTFSDRFCIATNGSFNSFLSPQDVLSCCEECGDGCMGGYDEMAWGYFEDVGIVTGGAYGSGIGCVPYRLRPCEHHTSGKRLNCTAYRDPPTPKCIRNCTTKSYKREYLADKYRTSTSYTVPSHVSKIQQEIFDYGPVQAAFSVYSDFFSYKSGVYQYVMGGYEGEHSARIIGWGTENDVDYWLAVNTWANDWGDNGYFKIIRGTDECGFESNIVAGLPLVK